MRNLLNYFDTDTFTLNGFATSSSLLGQFTSKQTPTLFFTGHLY
jgi:hypothetical protein